ncbi:unnamed protein product [Dibothriocephalus latus]|uniref:Uncharacterized protein n=1 Tax=Dibothriocephalus latus TaxID=60516 RepID=A0A3P7LIC5_DIBLA|nr:unnamed protein product [Dibothriocephalus latus]
MAISVNFEALLIGIGVFIFVCVLTFTLFYPFRAGFSEFVFLDRTPRKSSLSKQSKKEFLKRKRKPKKRTEQDDDGISESSLASADAAVVSNPPKPVPETPPAKTSSKPTEVQKPKSQAISTKSRETPLASPAQPEELLSPEVVVPTRETLKSEVTTNGWATEPPSPNFECTVEPADDSPQVPTTTSPPEVQRPGKAKKKSHKRSDHVNAPVHNRTHNMPSVSSTHAADFYANYKNGGVEKLSTNLSVLTDMQTKVKYLEKALKNLEPELAFFNEDATLRGHLIVIRSRAVVTAAILVLRLALGFLCRRLAVLTKAVPFPGLGPICLGSQLKLLGADAVTAALLCGFENSLIRLAAAFFAL